MIINRNILSKVALECRHLARRELLVFGVIVRCRHPKINIHQAIVHAKLTAQQDQGLEEILLKHDKIECFVKFRDLFFKIALRLVKSV